MYCYAECHYPECCGTIIIDLQLLKSDLKCPRMRKTVILICLTENVQSFDSLHPNFHITFPLFVVRMS